MKSAIELKEMIQARWPEWKPNATCLDDFWRVLHGFDDEMLEAILFNVASKYASKEPRLAWFRREHERLTEPDRESQYVASQDHWRITDEELDHYEEEQRKMREFVSDPDRRDEAFAALDSLPKWIGDAWSEVSENPEQWDSFVIGLVYTKMTEEK